MATSRDTRVTSGVRRFVELFAACGFVVAQPLLDVFGRAPEQFAFRGASTFDIVVFGIVIVIGPALVLWGIGTVVALVSARAGEVVHLVFLALLVGVGAIQLLRELGAGPLAVVLSVTLGIGFAVVHARTHVVRLWLSFLAVAPIVFLGLFLFVSDTARLLDSTAAHAVTVEDPSPVVMLVLDELPLVTLLAADGTIDEALFPNFAALAADSHWFRHTTSVASTTMYAVPAMLSGILPSEDQAAIAADHPDNLFTLLGDTYDLDVTESVTRLCPGSLCPDDAFTGAGLGGLLADARDVMEARASGRTLTRRSPPASWRRSPARPPKATTPPGSTRTRPPTTRRGSRRCSTSSTSSTMTPPRCTTSTCCCPTSRSDTWRTARSYEEFDPDYGRFVGVWYLPEVAALARQRHLLQAMYTDRLLGELVATLQSQGTYDDVTLVVAVDHGISFTPDQSSRGAIGSDQQPIGVASQLMYVPFFLKEPAQAAGDVVDANVWTVDVLPTIADVLDVEVPWAVDGRSALGEPRPEGPTSFYLNSFEPSGTDLGVLQEADTRELWTAALQLTIDRTFPPGADPSDPLRPWRLGPRPELVGSSATAAPLAGAAVLEVRYDPAIDLDLDGGRVRSGRRRCWCAGSSTATRAPRSPSRSTAPSRQRPRSWRTTRSRCSSIPPSTRRGRTAWRSSASHGDDGSQARDGGDYRRWPDASTGL